jgi:hypothetical protein
MGGFALAVVVIAILAVVASMLYYNYRRGQALMAFAASQGWTYVDEVPELEARWDGDPFGKGDRRQTDNAIRGSYQGFDLAAFEYSYETHTTDSKGQRSTTTHRYSVVALLTGSPLPGLSVSPEGGISRMFGRLFNTDIQLESEEFNRAFTVTCDDRKFASAVLHPRTMEALLAYRDVDWDIRGGDFVSLDSGNLDPTTITRRCDAMLTVLHGVPDFVWDDLGGRPSSLPPEARS